MRAGAPAARAAACRGQRGCLLSADGQGAPARPASVRALAVRRAALPCVAAAERGRAAARPFVTAGAMRREAEADWARLPAAPEPARPPAPPRSWAAGVAASTGVSADAPRWGEADLAYAPAAAVALLAAAAPAAAAAGAPLGPEGVPAAAAAGPADAAAAHDAAGLADSTRGVAAPMPPHPPSGGGAGPGQLPGQRHDRAPPAIQGDRQPLGRAGDENPQGGGEPGAPEPASAAAGGLHGTRAASARAPPACQPPPSGAAGGGAAAEHAAAASGSGTPAARPAAAAEPEPPPCAICDEPLGGDVALFPCGHFFCEACARRHLARQAACPACRARAKPASVFRCRHRRQAAPPRGEDPALAHVRAPALSC